jgi:hypothetical protein
MVSVFLYIKLEVSWLLDVSLVPWAIWLIKKFFDCFFSYREKQRYLEEKYILKMFEID